MVVDFTVVALFFTETLAKHYGAAAGRPSSAPLDRKKLVSEGELKAGLLNTFFASV